MMMHEILSVNNPRVKQWTELLTKKGRDKQQRFLIEGVHLVAEALKSGVQVETILCSNVRGLPEEVKVWADSSSSKSELVAVSEPILAKCTETQSPQAVCAIVRKPQMDVKDFLQAARSLVVVVDGVQDPGNLGTMMRSADAVKADGMLIGKGTVDPFNPKTVRSSMGSLFHIPIIECDLLEILPQAAAAGIQLVNTSLQAEQSCYEADFTRDTWFVFGNEGNGVSTSVAQLVERHLKIPMRGEAESLNVAMAATVLLYEAMRQRYFSL